MPSGGIFRFGRVINWWKIISVTDTFFVSFCYYCPWATLASVFHTPPGWPKRYIFGFAFLKEKKTLFRWTRWQTSSMQCQTFFCLLVLFIFALFCAYYWVMSPTSSVRKAYWCPTGQVWVWRLLQRTDFLTIQPWFVPQSPMGKVDSLFFFHIILFV